MAAHAKKIYVQIDIAGRMDRLWSLTQTPDLHQRWDLRFTDITYLPRPDLALPQRFLYGTRIGFALNIRGEGESVGHCDGADGTRTSALRFWSDDRKSLIREGSGYWKYVPLNGDNTIRFLTMYDYDVRFGRVGRSIDRVLFRPLIGWATAWSFDRLRLWIEKGIDPAASMRQALVYFIARFALALVWLYEGIVPKIVFANHDELAMLQAQSISAAAARGTAAAIGCIEVILGLILLLAWRARWPLWFTLIAMPAALAAVAIRSPQYLAAAFNPVTLNLAVFALAAIALLIVREVPSASRCVRQPPRSEDQEIISRIDSKVAAGMEK